MRRILLTFRDRDDFILKICFQFVKRVRFEMKSDATKSMILQPKSGAYANFATLAQIRST
jgi:hypothetical protein